MSSPYENLPGSAFWRSAIGQPDEESVADLYRPAFELTRDTALMTAGSCFAQHIHRALTDDGWNVLQAEDMAEHMPRRLCRRFGYNLFSARYGNIYTARQFRQLVEAALSEAPPAPLIWERDGRFVDALRPAVEPEGLATADEVAQARVEHLRAVGQLLRNAECIVFTLGLTECWIDGETGAALPTAPGTVAGTYDADRHAFRNFTYPEVLADLRASRDLLRAHGLPARMLLTVSPVPLAATASGRHVGPATTHSKSVLRAVCGHLQDTDADFDYFPAYEIITTPVAGGPYFAEDMRQPAPEGVETALSLFRAAHGAESPLAPVAAEPASPPGDEDEAACEDILLDAFRP